jgi:hypothetical protein
MYEDRHSAHGGRFANFGDHDNETIYVLWIWPLLFRAWLIGLFSGPGSGFSRGGPAKRFLGEAVFLVKSRGAEAVLKES